MAGTTLIDRSSLALASDLCVAPPVARPEPSCPPALLDLGRHCGAILRPIRAVPAIAARTGALHPAAASAMEEAAVQS